MSRHTAPSIAALIAQHQHHHLPQKGRQGEEQCSSAHRYEVFQVLSQVINYPIGLCTLVWFRLEEFVL